jgi:hypothetical protein
MIVHKNCNGLVASIRYCEQPLDLKNLSPLVCLTCRVIVKDTDIEGTELVTRPDFIAPLFHKE